MKIRMIIMALLVTVVSGCSTASDNQPKSLSTPGGPPICPHILGWPDDVKIWAKGAPWIKCLDITSCGIAKGMGSKVFYRPWDHPTPDGNPSIGGEKFGQEILTRLAFLPKEMWPDAIGFQNEFNNVSEKDAKCFIDMYDTLRKGGYRGMIVFGSYGPGGPTDKTEWARPHIKAACLKADAIETHEYWDLTIKSNDTFLAHRHVRAMNDYPWLKNKPWFIGEYGSDGVNKGEDTQHRSGWRDRNKLTEDEYIKQNEIYRHGDPKNGVVPCADNVLAVFLYQQGAPPHMWQGWETRGTKLMDYMKSTWKPTAGYFGGYVGHGEDRQPLVGAQVTLTPSGKTVKTDEKGSYLFFAVKPGLYKITVKSGSTVKTVEKYSVAAGDTNPAVNFLLK